MLISEFGTIMNVSAGLSFIGRILLTPQTSKTTFEKSLFLPTRSISGHVNFDKLIRVLNSTSKKSEKEREDFLGK